jgi:hypothetical protein
MIKLGGGCKHLYCSKDLANNNHGTRKKPNKVQIFLPIPRNAKTNPSYQVFFTIKARERASKR